MSGWKNFCKLINEESTVEGLRTMATGNFEEYGVYESSVQTCDPIWFFIAKEAGEKLLIAYAVEGAMCDCYKIVNGEELVMSDGIAKACKLNVANSKAIRSIFNYTNPISHNGYPITMGLGDRLGLASVGHIKLIKDYEVFPILAQQSIRELTLTDRTYDDVLASAVWAVFQENYTMGFGADGDHLKTKEEVQMAIDCGFTMITLDCSEHINNNITDLTDKEVDKLYEEVPEETREILEERYLVDKTKFPEFGEEEFKRVVLTYLDAIKHTIDVYNAVIKNCGRHIDFEMSIDETLTSTSPASHYFVANELLEAQLHVASLAPRFCGEFQKGVDYRGDIKQFTEEFATHCEIARDLGYKISVHSGSDKFKVFPIIGELTKGNYHIKTAGTNWLEAVRVIAKNEPSLYREMHKYAISVLDEAKKYYHISADPKTIPNVDDLTDAELPELMNVDDSRQVLHITYGLILTAKNADGSSRFKDAIYDALDKYEDAYNEALYTHIGKHLEYLGIKE